ncbi:MAG: hypothetical protein MR014_01595, partial [Oscillospiraceae bacterium]|nr:hypothetical protein [Oscillospiraceae bacterium]
AGCSSFYFRARILNPRPHFILRLKKGRTAFQAAGGRSPKKKPIRMKMATIARVIQSTFHLEGSSFLSRPNMRQAPFALGFVALYFWEAFENSPPLAYAIGVYAQKNSSKICFYYSRSGGYGQRVCQNRGGKYSGAALP